jgi:hypothetical protein
MAFVFLWSVQKQKNYSPDILVLGDSQISFGAGKVYLEFFDELMRDLPNLTQNQNVLKTFKNSQTAAIGVRSTSLVNWTKQEEGKIKDVICKIDKRWGVNAGVYGIEGNKNRVYVNMGQGEAYQICKPGISAFEAMFADEYYKPKLLVLAFLGNSAERWAKDQNSAIADVKATMRQIPSNILCIYLTTSPSYDKATNALRWVAQANIKQAFETHSSRCTFVEGFTLETVKAAEGNKAFFKTNDEGVVTDIHHPNLKAARKFFELRKQDLSRAVIEQIEKSFNKAGTT